MTPSEIQQKINKLIETKSYEILNMFLDKGFELNEIQINNLFKIDEQDFENIVKYQGIVNLTPNYIYEKYLYSIIKHEKYHEQFLNKLKDKEFNKLVVNNIILEFNDLFNYGKLNKFKSIFSFITNPSSDNNYKIEYNLYQRINQIEIFIFKYKNNFNFEENDCEKILLQINKIEKFRIYNHYEREISSYINNIKNDINNIYKNIQLKLIEELPIYNIDVKLKNILQNDNLNNQIKEKLKEIIECNDYINKNNNLITSEQKIIIENIELRVPDIIKNYLDIDKTIKNKENTDEMINKTLDNIVETIKIITSNINEDKLKNISIDYRYSENIKKEYGTKYK